MLNIEVAKDRFPREYVFATAYTFLDRCYFIIDDGPKNHLVRIWPKSGQELNSEEFLGKLDEISDYFNSFRANKTEIVDTMKKALFP